MDNRICVYAIAKNESKHVKRFLESMQDADIIVVQDTGSTDNTVELLKKYAGRYHVIVGETSYEKFRFDVARNDALKMVPEDCNIRVAMDLDEVLDPGWAKYLRDNWVEGEHTRASYNVCEGLKNFARTMSWVHSKGWCWKFPVHEALVPVEGTKMRKETLQCGEHMVMRHFPDQTKSRDQYHTLMRLRLDENPEDASSWNYWIRHCAFRKEREEIISCVPQIEEQAPLWDYKETTCLYNYIGDSYCELGQPEQGKLYYHKAIDLAPASRRAYVSLVIQLLKEELYTEALAILEACEKKSVHDMTWTWLDNEAMWSWQVPYYFSLCYFNLGQNAKAYNYAKEAWEKAPTRTKVLKHFQLMSQRI